VSWRACWSNGCIRIGCVNSIPALSYHRVLPQSGDTLEQFIAMVPCIIGHVQEMRFLFNQDSKAGVALQRKL
jgi:hypothetical protein